MQGWTHQSCPAVGKLAGLASPNQLATRFSSSDKSEGEVGRRRERLAKRRACAGLALISNITLPRPRLPWLCSQGQSGDLIEMSIGGEGGSIVLFHGDSGKTMLAVCNGGLIGTCVSQQPGQGLDVFDQSLLVVYA